MRGVRIGAALACLTVLTACSEEPKPVYQDEPVPQAIVSEYDAALEPSAAVLALVPTAASTVTVTDFAQLRLVLGFGSLDSSSSVRDRARFWRLVPRTASLSGGLLRPVEDRLREDFGFSQDDVAWEATYSGDAEGWVLAFGEKTPMDAVTRAVRAGVGPLDGAIVDVDRRLVTSTEPPASADSWGAEEALVRLAGREAVSTFLARGCLPFDSVFGDGMQAQLAAAPAAALGDLDELDAFAVALGGELVTVLLGDNRSDAFERARLAEVMPPTNPEFALAMSRPVADPSTGRLGYTLDDPVAAAELTRKRDLPFAVCSD